MQEIKNKTAIDITDLDWTLIRSLTSEERVPFPISLALIVASKMLEDSPSNVWNEYFDTEDSEILTDIQYRLMFDVENAILDNRARAIREANDKPKPKTTIKKKVTKKKNKKKKTAAKKTDEKKLWPVEQFNSDSDQYEWIDSADQVYDPEAHAWNKVEKKPSVDKSGKFRKKRGTANQQKPDNQAAISKNNTYIVSDTNDDNHVAINKQTSENEKIDIDLGGNDPEKDDEDGIELTISDEPPELTDEDRNPENYSSTLQALIRNLESITTPHLVDEIADHGFVNMLNDKERAIFAECVHNKRESISDS